MPRIHAKKRLARTILWIEDTTQISPSFSISTSKGLGKRVQPNTQHIHNGQNLYIQFFWYSTLGSSIKFKHMIGLTNKTQKKKKNAFFSKNNEIQYS